MELWGVVSSMKVTSSNPTSTMSGRAEVTKLFSGMVDIGLSFSRIPGRSAYSIILLPRCSWMPRTKAKRDYHAAKCTFLAVMPRAIREDVVNGGLFVATEGTAGIVFSFQRLRLSGVGTVSVPALRRNDNSPAGRPCRIPFHIWLESSSSATSRILFWTVSSLGLLSYFSIILSLSSLLQWLLDNLLEMVEIEDLALSNRPTEDWWILWFLQYSSSVKIHEISLIRGSCEVDMDDRKVNFALVLRSDKEGVPITFGWWWGEVVKHLGKFSYFLIFLREAACIFLMADSGIGYTAMTKCKEGTRYLLYIYSLYSPRTWTRFSSFCWKIPRISCLLGRI